MGPKAKEVTRTFQGELLSVGSRLAVLELELFCSLELLSLGLNSSWREPAGGWKLGAGG